MLEIRDTVNGDETLVFDMLLDVRDDWSDYHGSEGWDRHLNRV